MKTKFSKEEFIEFMKENHIENYGFCDKLLYTHTDGIVYSMYFSIYFEPQSDENIITNFIKQIKEKNNHIFIFYDNDNENVFDLSYYTCVDVLDLDYFRKKKLNKLKNG